MRKFHTIAAIAALAIAQVSGPRICQPDGWRRANMYANNEYRSKTRANSADHTTLVAAVKAAGLVDTLSGMGPFTVFAPTNGSVRQIACRHRRHAVEA